MYYISFVFWLLEHHSSWEEQVHCKRWQKGARRKWLISFLRKNLYNVNALAMLNVRDIGKTVIMRTQRIKILSDGHKAHVFEMNLIYLQYVEGAFKNFHDWPAVWPSG